jgi:hypothetical protein
VTRPRPAPWIAVATAIAGLLGSHLAASEEPAAPGVAVPEPAVYLVAARQKARIAESLRRAGIRVADDILDSPALLRVTVGNEKSFRSCGTRNNVKYALRIGGATGVELKKAGWTGTCEPNVFDDLSAQLAHALRATHRGESR